MEKIKTSGETLLGIVNDILDLSKAEQGQLSILNEKYDIASTINDAVNLNVVRIGTKPLKFILDVSPETPAALFGDAKRIRQILNNLLSNAIKYTDTGSVTLKVWTAQSKEKPAGPDDKTTTLYMRVSDTGIGVKPENMNLLFEEYKQVESGKTHQVEGTGLGLPITRILLRKMGGEISVESEFGKGSTFTAWLPQGILDKKTLGEETVRKLANRDYKNARVRKGERLVRKPMPQGKILIVDDMQINLDVAKGLLAAYQLQIDTALSGQEAIDKVGTLRATSQKPYDLIFMDHMMPGMDGVEATKKIREWEQSVGAEPVPIIALTANVMPEIRDMLLKCGFSGYLAKPMDLIELDALLNKYVGSKYK
jgi:CheY-like chemotaxis protein